jgi:hypothetical protein
MRTEMPSIHPCIERLCKCPFSSIMKGYGIIGPMRAQDVIPCAKLIETLNGRAVED